MSGDEAIDPLREQRKSSAAARTLATALFRLAGRIASNAVPATPEELEKTVKMIQGFGRRGQSIRADTRSRRYRINPIRKAVERVDLGNRTKEGATYAAGSMGRSGCHRAAQGRLASTG
jgi:hypothetical protein